MKDPDKKKIGIGKTTIVGKMTTDAKIDTTMGTHLDTTIGNLRTIGAVTPNPETMGSNRRPQNPRQMNDNHTNDRLLPLKNNRWDNPRKPRYTRQYQYQP